MAKLIVHQGKDEGETFTFEPPIKFGRDEDNDFTVSDPRVSRIHGRISNDGEAYYIEDLGSSNGTHVNGISTSRSQIVHGDLIQVGDTELIFKLEDEPADQEVEDDHPDQQQSPEASETDEVATEMNMAWLLGLLKFVAALLLIAGIGVLSYYLVSWLL